jgi:hypothetical protein
MTLPEPFARYDPDSSSWRTCEDYLPLGMDASLDEFSDRWPTSGTTRAGMAYALPTSAPLTDGGASSSSRLLATPVALEGIKPSNTMGVARRRLTGEVFLTNQIVTLCGLDPSEA